MSRLSSHSILASLAVAVAFMGVGGCDTGSDDRPDSERIVGTWEAETFNATTAVPGVSIPVLDLESGDDRSAFTFEANERFAFVLDPADGRVFEIPQIGLEVPITTAVNLFGTYTLNEDDQTIDFVEDVVKGFPVVFTLGYRLRGDDDLELIAEDPETLALLIGLATDDPVIETIATVVTGGSIALQRD